MSETEPHRMPTTSDLQVFYAPVQDELEQVRRSIDALWGEVLSFVDGAGGTYGAAGGKLLRPALCLLSAGAAGAADAGGYVDLATAMEVFHIAALTHDDVVDGAELRRGMQSLNARWDDHAAVLGGDYLVARGLGILAQYGSCELLLDGARCMQGMAEIELRAYGRDPSSFTEDACLAIARAKTASLFALACSAPCRFHGQSRWQAMHDFGYALGTAFQLVDDLLDLVQSEDTLGKPACGDLRAGKQTVPILYLREALDSQSRPRLERFRNGSSSNADKAWVRDALERTGARRRTEELAQSFAQAAKGTLRELPRGPFAEAMLGIAEFVVSREA